MLQPDSTPALEPTFSFFHKIATAMPPNVPHLLHVESRQVARESRSKLQIPRIGHHSFLTTLTCFNVGVSNISRR